MRVTAVVLAALLAIAACICRFAPGYYAYLVASVATTTLVGVGINILLGLAGEVSLGQVGFDRRFDYAAIGSVTNLASRLCDEAKAGQILVSQRIFGLLEPSIEARHIGDLNLKGFHRAMPTYEVLGWRGS